MGFIDIRSVRLRERHWYDPRKEWTLLTQSGALAGDVAFAEFLTALESIQQDFVRVTDAELGRIPGGMSTLRVLISHITACHSVCRMGDRQVARAIRDAVEHQKLVAWPGERAIRERVAEIRAIHAASKYWAKATPVQAIPISPHALTKAVTPSQLCKREDDAADGILQSWHNGSKAARWRTRKARIANARQIARERHLPKLREAADRFERNNTAVEQAKLAENVYHVGKPAPEGWLNISTDSAALARYKLDPEHLSIPNTNFRAQVYLPDPKIFGSDMKPQIVFRGTEMLSASDWDNNASQAKNEDSDYYRQAIRIGQKLKESSLSIEIDGHSLGGGLASAASIASGRHAVTFNPAGLHPATVERYGGHPEGATNIDEYVVGGDALTVAQSASFGVLPDAMHTRRYFLPGYGGPFDRHSMQEVIDGFETQKREDQAYIVEVLTK